MFSTLIIPHCFHNYYFQLLLRRERWNHCSACFDCQQQEASFCRHIWQEMAKLKCSICVVVRLDSLCGVVDGVMNYCRYYIWRTGFETPQGNEAGKNTSYLKYLDYLERRTSQFRLDSTGHHTFLQLATNFDNIQIRLLRLWKLQYSKGEEEGNRFCISLL